VTFGWSISEIDQSNVTNYPRLPIFGMLVQ